MATKIGLCSMAADAHFVGIQPVIGLELTALKSKRYNHLSYILKMKGRIEKRD
jgi:hypothetical protein